MTGSRYLIPLLLPWLAAAGPLPENVDPVAGTGEVANANHIFNSIHDSMRQFGSSLNHNGMGVFVATVPEGTEFYHGTSKKDRVNGTEWLAFEPEHAMIFARARGSPPGGRPGQGPPGGPDGYGPPPGYGPPGYGPPGYGPPGYGSYDDNDDDDRRHHADDDDRRGKKHHGDKTRPDKHHDNEDRPCKKGKHDGDKKHADRPDKHHGPPPSRNGSRPDAPHHGPPPPDSEHRGPPPSRNGSRPDAPHHGPPPPDSEHRGPPPPGFEHHGPPRDDFEHHGPPPKDSKHHGPPREGAERHGAEAFEHHGPPRGEFEHHGPPKDFEHHGPPRKDFEHHGPPREGSKHHEAEAYEHHGPPHDDFEHHGPPRGDFQHHGPTHEESEHHDSESSEHHGPRTAFKGFPAHDFNEEVSHDRPEDHEHEHHGPLSLPLIGFWVRRLGDMLRNPKRNASPSPISSKPETRTILDKQEPLTKDEPEQDRSGYLHTYRTKHDLRLLYVDGQSAAKSTKGTLDTQDILLLNGKLDEGSHGGMFGEKERAVQLCKIAHEQWGDRIDGILRMEGGFEIILCSFADHLDVVNIAKTQPKAGGGPGGNDKDGLNYYRAVAARYFGIGGGRVVLNYENFVTAFAYPEAIYFDETDRPRLNNESAELETVRKAVNKIAARKGDDKSTFDWQAVTDMIIERYADRIEILTSGLIDDFEGLQSELDRALRPFIDYSARNATREAERCASQFYPQDVDTTTVAARAVKQLSLSLCYGLAAAAEKDTYEASLATVKELREYLGWTTWKQCRGCALNEICFLPIWPTGSAEDFVQPKCRSDASMHGGGGYWGGFGGPRRGGKDGKRDEKKRD